jgi:hypothetical protein
MARMNIREDRECKEGMGMLWLDNYAQASCCG